MISGDLDQVQFSSFCLDVQARTLMIAALPGWAVIEDGYGVLFQLPS
jgi:hypothetical protein